MRDYNYQAKRAKKPQVILSKDVIDISGTLESLDPDIMIQSFSEKSVVDEFVKEVKRNVSKGVPMNWSVMLGIFPEKRLPQNAGGHMRIIIGYNEKAKEIIYTDSWGDGHEFKRIPLNHAVAMTTGMFIIKAY